MPIPLSRAALVVLLAMGGAGLAKAQDATQGGPGERFDAPGLWLRACGVKFTAPFTVQCDTAAIVVDSNRFEIAWDDRPPNLVIESGTYNSGHVYAYVGSRLAAVRDSLGMVPADSLEAILGKADSLLAALQLPALDITVNENYDDAIVMRNGMPTMVHFAIAPNIPMPRAEVVRRVYSGIVGNLQDGLCVVWGENYFASYTPSRAARLDSGITAWESDVSGKDSPHGEAGLPHQFGGEFAPRELARDIARLAKDNR